MKLDIEFKNADVVAKKMGDRGVKLKGVIKTILAKAAFLVERHGKIEAPVRTGRLRASIGGGAFQGGSFPFGEGVEITDRFARVGPTVEYAKHVHERNPFMTRALGSARTEIKEMVDEEVEKALA